MTIRLNCALAALVALESMAAQSPASPTSGGLSIAHDGAGCIVAGKQPQLTAQLTPPERVARARAFFRAGGTPHWYFVEMPARGAAYVAVLPRPKKGVAQIDYYIEALDRDLGTSRTQDYTQAVVTSDAECAGRKLLAVAPGRAGRIVVGGPEGAPRLPAGFEAADIAAAGSAASATTAAAATGSGALKGVLIGAGVAAAAGGVAVAAGSGDGGGSGGASQSSPPISGSSPSNPTPSPSPASSPSPAPAGAVWSVQFAAGPNGLDVSACSLNTAFCSQVISVAANGAFNDVWSPSTPVVRAQGTMTASAVSAILTCINTSATGSLSAAAAGGEYTGSATLSGRTTTVRIVRGAGSGGPCI